MAEGFKPDWAPPSCAMGATFIERADLAVLPRMISTDVSTASSLTL
jgi:hypothetical protein